MESESDSGFEGLLRMVKSVKTTRTTRSRGWLQLLFDAGVDPTTEKDEPFSVAVNLSLKPLWSNLFDAEYFALDSVARLIHHLSHGPSAMSLACFLESVHSQRLHGALFRPEHSTREGIQSEAKFGKAFCDVRRVACRNDWTNMLKKVFEYRTSRVFYLLEVSARPIAPPVALVSTWTVAPTEPFEGSAHQFYPIENASFATTVSHMGSGYAEIEVEQYTLEERSSIASGLRADGVKALSAQTGSSRRKYVKDTCADDDHDE